MLYKRPDRRIFCEKEPSVSRSMGQHLHLRDYMIIAAYGLVIFLIVANVIVLQAAYPACGLANLSFVVSCFHSKIFYAY